MADSEEDDPKGGVRANDAKRKRKRRAKGEPAVRPVVSSGPWRRLARDLGVESLYDPALVEDCLNRFKKKYRGVDATNLFFHATIGSAQHVRHLLHEDTHAQDLKPETQLKLVAFMNTRDPTEIDHYDAHARLIDQDPGARSELVELYRGTYRYFRFQPPAPGWKSQYNFGKIVIGKTGDRPTFAMWSANMDRQSSDPDFTDTPPENVGEIFRGNGKLYFVGHREKVMRLAICREPKKNVATGVIDLARAEIGGLLLSVTTETHDPFAARFVLVHESNRSALERYGNFSSNQNGKFFGQDSFENLWGDPHHMMMLIPKTSGLSKKDEPSDQ